ncbi:hypothetical protein WJX73_002236 [Symbiochloris irregularis]|uniref:Uncharacterized protein n=1 Tax=Symbiochloris irregularis TaxID=706552 RepID=A0AAW1PQB6_9CHLO
MTNLRPNKPSDIHFLDTQAFDSNAVSSEDTLDGLLQHPRLPAYLGNLYRKIIAVRTSPEFSMSPELCDARNRELSREMCRVVSQLNDVHMSTADQAKVHAELRAAVLGMRSLTLNLASSQPIQLARVHLLNMQQSSTVPPDLLQSVYMARMADAKLSIEQCKAFVTAYVAMREKLQQAEAERRELLQPLKQMLQGAGIIDSPRLQTDNVLAFHRLIDQQTRIRDAECSAMVEYTAHIVRMGMLSWEQTARLLALDHPQISADYTTTVQNFGAAAPTCWSDTRQAQAR